MNMQEEFVFFEAKTKEIFYILYERVDNPK